MDAMRMLCSACVLMSPTKELFELDTGISGFAAVYMRSLLLWDVNAAGHPRRAKLSYIQ